MENAAIVGLIFRLLGYGMLLHLIARWSWEEGSRPGLARSGFFALLRLAAGALASYLLLLCETTWPSELGGHHEDLVLIARVLLWTAFFGVLCGARVHRIAVGVLGAMLFHLVADLLFPKSAIYGWTLFV